MDILEQAKLFRVQFEVLLHFGVVHEVGKLFRNGEVTVGHHLLARVDDGRAHYASLTAGWGLLEVPQSSYVISSFEAYRFETFVQATLYGRQSACTRTNNCYLLHFWLKQ